MQAFGTFGFGEGIFWYLCKAKTWINNIWKVWLGLHMIMSIETFLEGLHCSQYWRRWWLLDDVHNIYYHKISTYFINFQQCRLKLNFCHKLHGQPWQRHDTPPQPPYRPHLGPLVPQCTLLAKHIISTIVHLSKHRLISRLCILLKARKDYM